MRRADAGGAGDEAVQDEVVRGVADRFVAGRLDVGGRGFS